MKHTLEPLYGITYTDFMTSSAKRALFCKYLAVFLCFLQAVFLAAQEQTPEKLRAKVVAAAKQYIGVPYRYGGLTAAGMDCSGFIYTVAREAAKVQLPRTAHAMYSFCKTVPDEKREPGDIVFFKDGGEKITHAGLYIGNNQFIHAVSDGENTGVIVSSLNQGSWKRRYAGCGQFLPPSLPQDTRDKKTTKAPASAKDGADEKTSENAVKKNDKEAAEQTENNAANAFLDDISAKIFCAFSAQLRWNFFSADKFVPTVTGASFQTDVYYKGRVLRPGLSAAFRLEPLMGIYQFPLCVTLGLPYGFCLYAGPVFTAGNAHSLGTDRKLSAPIFPGTFGALWQSPSFRADKSEVSFIQDINWTVFSGAGNTRLDFTESAASGLRFSTGIRVTISAKDLFN